MAAYKTDTFISCMHTRTVCRYSFINPRPWARSPRDLFITGHYARQRRANRRNRCRSGDGTVYASFSDRRVATGYLIRSSFSDKLHLFYGGHWKRDHLFFTVKVGGDHRGAGYRVRVC